MFSGMIRICTALLAITCISTSSGGTTVRLIRSNNMSRVMRKPVFGVSDQVQHKPGCTVTEDGWRLEILDLGSRGIVLSV